MDEKVVGINPRTKLAIGLPNQEVVTAEIFEWITALLLELPPQYREKVFNRVKRGKVFYQTPGSYVIQAEGLKIGSK